MIAINFIKKFIIGDLRKLLALYAHFTSKHKFL